MNDHEDDVALLDAYSRTVIDTLERTRAGVVSLQLARPNLARVVEVWSNPKGEPQ
jgi:hypothetical protein